MPCGGVALSRHEDDQDSDRSCRQRLPRSHTLREASAAPHWNKSVTCEETDPEGRVIPTRYGNADLGWNHFSGKHNIKKCRVVDAALAGKVDKKNGGRLE